jgi:putative Mg2+ transporter-C (MgtC) family protein
MIFSFDNEIETLLFLLPKVIIATICGIIIGWERETKKMAAGIRTHVLICVSVALFTSVGFIITKTIPLSDPTRIIGQIISSVGFLCIGIIFKQDDKIHGITSSAFIFFITSIGVMIGVGYLLIAITLTIGLLLLSMILSKIEQKLKLK